ncbi:MAG: retron system putative HNH endonuclease [Pseudobdellovibrionaceae bacterium]
MRRLDRSIAQVPTALGNYTYGIHTWENVTTPDKANIRASLEQMQGRRCAYCEGSLDELGQHIEHFRRKRVFPQLTFAWANLVWCCDSSDSCGHYKDRRGWPYDINNLIDPCGDDPDKFFRFRTDGSISIRSGLTPQERIKAEETLRVLNLNPGWGRLRNMRRRAVSSYLDMAAGEHDLSEADLQQIFQDELVLAADQPFYTAIRHALTLG